MRERLMSRLKALVPGYAFWPIVCCLFLNLAVYFLPRLIHVLWVPRYHDFSLPLDARLPFVPAFILFYVAAYVSWYLGYVLICRKHPQCCGVVFADLIAKVICLVFFIFLPTSIQRPVPEGDGPILWLVRLIYAADTPADNLFPSIHCLESWLVWRGMIGQAHLSRKVKIVYFVSAMLVFAATLLVKQHVIVDIPAGIAVGEIGLYASRRLHLGERYARWLRNRGQHEKA